jgi:hypothetical protein
LPRLTYLKAAASDSVHITDAQIALLQIFDAEILAEGARDEDGGVLRVFLTPDGVVGQGIRVDGLLRAAMD